jgi:hypothetical protein
MSKGESVAHLTHRMHAWVIKLAEHGEFDGHLAARVVLDCYVQHMAANDDPDGKFLAGEVLTGVIHPPVVARKTSMDVRSVRRANDWLHEQGFIYIEDDPDSVKYRRVKSIVIMSVDEDSERKRKLTGGYVTRAASAPRKRSRRLKVVPELDSMSN